MTEIFFENEGAKKFAQDLLRDHKTQNPIPLRLGLPKEIKTTSHQGIAFRIQHEFYLTSNESIDPKKYPFILCCNHLEDVQNLGAIVRSAAAFGCGLLVHEERRSVALNATAVKISAGQAFRVRFHTVSNLAPFLKNLEDLGYQLVGLEKTEDAQSLYSYEGSRPLALVVGSEAEGLAKPVSRSLHQHLWIPMRDGVESLNAAQAATVALSWLYHSVER